MRHLGNFQTMCWSTVDKNRRNYSRKLNLFDMFCSLYSVLYNECACFLQTLESQKQSIEVDYKKGYQITEHKAILGGTLESLLSDKPSYKAALAVPCLAMYKKFA